MIIVKICACKFLRAGHFFYAVYAVRCRIRHIRHLGVSSLPAMPYMPYRSIRPVRIRHGRQGPRGWQPQPDVKNYTQAEDFPLHVIFCK